MLCVTCEQNNKCHAYHIICHSPPLAHLHGHCTHAPYSYNFWLNETQTQQDERNAASTEHISISIYLIWQNVQISESIYSGPFCSHVIYSTISPCLYNSKLTKTYTEKIYNSNRINVYSGNAIYFFVLFAQYSIWLAK